MNTRRPDLGRSSRHVGTYTVGEPTRNQSFGYDDLNRLTLATQADGAFNQTFTIDPWGNTQQSGTWNFQQSFTAANQIQGYPYDGAGDLLSDGFSNYGYDAEHRLTSATRILDGLQSTYTYGPDGDRVRKDTGGSFTEYIYFAGEPIAEKTPSGWTDYIFAGDQRIALATGSTSAGTQFYHADHLGSERMMTDAAGNVISNCLFAPFGQQVSCSPDNPANHYKFTGKERDGESGLDFMEARYYGSSMGRFMSPDPLGGHYEDPQTLNRYSYVRNNPLNLSDPTGLDFNLQCTQTKDNASTCQGGVVGTTTTTTDANGNTTSTFTPTVVTSASLQDPNSGNTATVNQNGVQITTGGQAYQGQFISNTPAADIQGSGELKDFNFHVDGNCGGTCMSSGEWSYHGSLNDARALLYQRGSFTIPFEDMRAGFGFGAHPFSTQHRFGGADCSFFSCPNSPHLSVAYDPGTSNYLAAVKQEPKANVPQTSNGGFHVDFHADWLGHAKDVSNNPQ